MHVMRNPGLAEIFLVNPRRSPDVLARLADYRLRRLVAYAYEHVPLYRERWRAAGVSPRDIRSRADLPLLPMVDKDAIVDAGAEAWSSERPARGLIEMRTSGTSGRAIHVVRTIREIRVMRRAILRHYHQLGMMPWNDTVTVASGWLKAKGAFIGRVAHTRHIEPDMPLDEQVAILAAFRPVAIVGQTGALYLLARELLRRRAPYWMRWVVPTGATLMPEMRQAMRSAFGSDPCDMYGAVEVGPIAWQCSRGSYHVDADRIIVEIVDEDGRPRPPGQPGQVVITNLHSWTMPFIRYRLLDVAACLPDVCGCGCRFPLMGAVRGRINDFLPTPSGELVSPHFFFHLFDDAAHNPVKDWRITQEGPAHLVYEYVPEQHFFDPAALARGLDRVRQRFGADCRLEARAVDHLPLTPAGKRRCIVSKLRPEAKPWDEVWIRPLDEAPSVPGGAGNGYGGR